MESALKTDMLRFALALSTFFAVVAVKVAVFS